VSTRSSIWYGEDDKGRSCHFYWELGERELGVGAPIYLSIESDGKELLIRLPKDIGQKIREFLEKPGGGHFEVL
jgi:hypothetical protein